MYLWFVLLKRGALHLVYKLRRPASALGFVALIFCFCLLYKNRHAEFFEHLVRPEALAGCALVMLCGSLFKGFLQRGLVFELPDVEFLFTGPFTRRQIVSYRLLPGYLYSAAQGLIFVGLFSPHLKHPWLMFVCLTLFQAVCFHLAAGAAIFAGTLSEQTHARIRWMMLGAYALITVLYFRIAWDLKAKIGFARSTLSELLFYPSVTMTDIATASWVKEWAVQLVNTHQVGNLEFVRQFLYVAGLAFAAILTLWVILHLKGDLFEPSLATSARASERKIRLQQGLGSASHSAGQSARLPRSEWFRGAGAIVWKNLVVASRSRRELLLAGAFTLVYTAFLIGLRWLLKVYTVQGGGLPERQVRDFDLGLVGMLVFLAFLLQRSFPFDFRRDGTHLMDYRTLPIQPLAVALAELAVPVMFCLAFQTAGLVVLMIFARFEWTTLLWIALAFPAVAVGLNAVWNAHYLLAATRRAGGRAESASPVTLLMVVALSFLIFYPAVWLAVEIGRNLYVKNSEAVAFMVWLVAQYLVDFLLVLFLAKLFQRFELSRQA